MSVYDNIWSVGLGRKPPGHYPPDKKPPNNKKYKYKLRFFCFMYIYTPAPPEGVYCFTSLRPSVRPRDMFRHIFLSNYWWQKSAIWSQVSYWYAILWEAFLDPSDSYFLFADLVGFYTHWTYMRGYHKWALAHSSSCSFLCLCLTV